MHTVSAIVVIFLMTTLSLFAEGDSDIPNHSELAFGLYQRNQTFPSGVLEARETTWDVPSDLLKKAEESSKLLTTIPLSAEKAQELAIKFEKSMLQLLGAGKQRAWAYLEHPAGAKLLEIPLVQGNTPENPIQDPNQGKIWRGFQNGTIAVFHETKNELHLVQGTSDSAFPFRPSYVDPTLEDFNLLSALKNDDQNVIISPYGKNRFRVSLRGNRIIPRYYFYSGEASPLLLRAELYRGQNVPSQRLYLGSYGELINSKAYVPYSVFLIAKTPSDQVRIRLYTVTHWTVRQISTDELQIKTTKDTKIIRHE